MREASPSRSHRALEVLARLEASSHLGRSGGFIVRAPLRICPLGAHVDHQGGVVTGMTINREVVLAALPDPEPVVRLESLNFSGEVAVGLTDPVPSKKDDWADYLRAAVLALSRDHDLSTGFRGVVAGDLPGAGVSSSAAVLVAYLLALMRVNEIESDRETISALVQRAENEYVGVASGRLDQSIILFGEAGKLTRVDCSNLSMDQIPLAGTAPAFDVLVAFSGASRALAASGFNTRVAECRDAAKLLLELDGQRSPENPVLSQVHPEVFARFAADLPRTPRRRATHYFTEQRRVGMGVEAWRGGDLERFGRLMTASGASSIHNYESGASELITLYQLLCGTPGVIGARFSGGGFGGSCIAIVLKGEADTIIESVSAEYEAAHPVAAENASFHLCAPADSVRVEELPI